MRAHREVPLLINITDEPNAPAKNEHAVERSGLDICLRLVLREAATENKEDYTGQELYNK